MKMRKDLCVFYMDKNILPSSYPVLLIYNKSVKVV